MSAQHLSQVPKNCISTLVIRVVHNKQDGFVVEDLTQFRGLVISDEYTALWEKGQNYRLTDPRLYKDCIKIAEKPEAIYIQTMQNLRRQEKEDEQISWMEC